jgi:hypothetical protein
MKTSVTGPEKAVTVEKLRRKERCWPLFLTIVAFLVNELGKKQRSF